MSTRDLTSIYGKLDSQLESFYNDYGREPNELTLSGEDIAKLCAHYEVMPDSLFYKFIPVVQGV